MAPPATFETIGRNPSAVVHMLSQKFHSQSESKGVPIVFFIPGDISDRGSLESLIRREGWQTETFGSVQDFLDRPRPPVPSCLILPLSPSSLNGLQAQKKIARERRETPIIIISGCEDTPTAVQAMKAGAVDFLVNPSMNEGLLGTIREALERSFILLNREAERRTLRDCYDSLTPRERQVMALVVSGRLNKQVGFELGISEITVKTHRGKVMQKMKANSLADLVRMAAQLGPSRQATYLS